MKHYGIQWTFIVHLLPVGYLYHEMYPKWVLTILCKAVIFWTIEGII